MSEITNIVDIATARTSDLAELKGKADASKDQLMQAFTTICSALNIANDAGLTVDFRFQNDTKTGWQVQFKVCKEF